MAEIGRKSENASTAEANRYLSGLVAPTEATSRALARALGVSERLTLTRAGLLVPLLKELPRLLFGAQERCAMADRSFGETLRSQRSRPKAAHGFMVCDLSPAKKPQWYCVPLEALSAVFIGIAGFPLRGEVRRAPLAAIESGLASVALEYETTARATGPLPRELAHAAAILGAKVVSGEHRRAIAGEFVRSWTRIHFGDFARAAEGQFYAEPTAVASLVEFEDRASC
jgi:hypothetical protein